MPAMIAGILWVFFYIIFFLATFIVMGFLQWEWNPSKWEYLTRALLIAVPGIGATIAIVSADK